MSSKNQYSRRGFMGITMLSSAFVLVGCAPAQTGTGMSAAPTGPQQRGGTLRLAAPAGSGTDMDPHDTGADAAIKNSLYDGLVGYDHKMQLENALAKTFEPEDGDLKTWILTLRDDVKWHDGKSLSVDDVIFTIKRIADPDNPRAAAALLRDIDLAKLERVDDLTLRIHLKSANSQLRQSFTPSFSSIVPVGFDPKKPIGTGPFSHVSFAANQRWTGKRFDDYWRVKGGAYLDGIEVIGFASSVAALNALMAGQVDALPNVVPAQLMQVQNRSDILHTESETGLIMQVGMNCGPGQDFEDPRVRQAFRLIFDRKQMVDSVYAGHGIIGGNDIGVFPQWDAGVDPELPVRTRDLDEAKRLLKEAGREGMRTTIRVGDRIPGMVSAAEIMQLQAKEAGVTIDIDLVADATQYYSDGYYTAQLQIDYTSTLDMFGAAYYYLLSDADYNSTAYSNETVDRLFAEGLALPDEGYNQKMREMSKVLYDEGPWIVWGAQNVIDLYTNKVVGIQKDAGGNGLNGNQFWSISLAA